MKLRDYSLYEVKGKDLKIGDYVRFSYAEVSGEGYLTTQWRKRFVVKYYADNKVQVVFFHRNKVLLEFIASSKKCECYNSKTGEFPDTHCPSCYGIGYLSEVSV